MLGARQLSPRSYPDQHQLTSLLYQQFDISTSSHKRNFSMKLMATSIITLCTLRFLFLTPNTNHPVFTSFSFSVETPSQFQYLVSGVSCRVSHNAKQAVTLNSASSKFRNDIIEVIIATYRLKG